MNDISIIPLHGKTPRIDQTAFIAPGCRIIGDVEIGPGASIWYNCVLRADVNFIRIGARSNVQDGTVIHCDSAEGGMNGSPTIIEDDALVGHMAMLHGCTVRSGALVGLGSIVMDGCVIEANAMLAAGAMLTPGKTIPTGQMWGGRPASFMRELNESWSIGNQMAVAHYVRNGAAHKSAVDSI
ncbi:MAG: gamma carbonic anhydrase family protein [Sphingomonadales bacterium]|jgi:carbonic anhydrase/acetyltransferase-like protein (isoleucine patch superfamily)|nr:gamma carbonic anhydrase family protein [Sphingomonadales bacterium]MBK6721451.1 gamma carbonic anhydrase family protein [Sphingomonadales bacterium]MBK8273291.1 gamma carbonic anhydrase family protein [Sphingomonadales bacterium]MBK8859819.1 gamma carbonic anhydrase family protein [Sphingomonadales bacterium]